MEGVKLHLSRLLGVSTGRNKALIWMLVLTTLMTTSSGKSTDVCDTLCECHETAKGLVVKCCRGQEKQSKVPSLPSDTIEVDLTECRIEDIPPGVFGNLTKLKTLTANKGTFETLSKSAFVGLQQLEVLRMQDGKLKDVEKGLFSNLSSLRILHLELNQYLKIGMMPLILEGLNQTKIKEIHLDEMNYYKNSDQYILRTQHLAPLYYLDLDIFSCQKCSVRAIEGNALYPFQHTTCVSLSGNVLSLIGWQDLAHILGQLLSNHRTLVLDLENIQNIMPDDSLMKVQFLESCSTAMQDKIIQCPRLSKTAIKKLILQNPNLTAVSIPSTLQRANIGYSLGPNGIGNYVVYSNNLTHVKADKITSFKLDGPFIGATCLKYVSLAGSRLAISYSDTLANLPSLQFLNLSKCHIGMQTPTAQTSLIKNMPELRVLDLSGNELQLVSFSHLETHAPKLKRLLLQDNELTKVPDVKSKTLKWVDLSMNHLTSLSANDMNALEFLSQESLGVQISLNDNPFDCQCSKTTYKLINWFQSTSINITDRERVTCSVFSNNGVQQKAILDINAVWFRLKCNRDLLFGLIGAISGALLVIVVVSTAYRNRWLLKYSWYRLHEKFIRKFSRQPFGDEEEDDDKNVYIISVPDRNAEDYQFVHGHLTETLQDVGFKPIYHMETLEYFLGNRPNTYDIFDGIEDSSYCILVLTPALLDDVDTQWALFAVHMAMAKDKGFLIVVDYTRPSLGLLMDGRFEAIRRALVINGSLEWSAEGRAGQVFNEQLRQKLLSQ